MTEAGRLGTAADAVPSQLPEARLLELAAEGNADAFDILLRPRLPRLFRMAVAITRSEANARDAVQEASIHAWRELPRLRDHDRFDAWLSQILVNACRSLLRRTRRINVRELDMDGVDSTGTEPVTRDTDVETLLETDLIRRAFERLDPTVRALLVLHYVEERPLGEIARVLGRPVGTVKWRLSNARRALDRALELERR